VGTTVTRPMTFEEFERLPNPRGGWLELHHGEVVEVAAPKHGHHRRQRRLRRLMEPLADPVGEVELEFAYRPLPEHECWVADVGFVSRERYDRIPLDGYLAGAPDLVIEVLSPSNRDAEIEEKRKLCLGNGSHEFWVVDDEAREIKVSTPDGRTVTYRAGQQIPLFFALGSALSVEDIFS
jgi:Uma2 family endonuclease